MDHLVTLRHLRFRNIFFFTIITLFVIQFIGHQVQMNTGIYDLLGFFLVPIVYYVVVQWRHKRPLLEIVAMERVLSWPKLLFFVIGTICLGFMLNIVVFILFSLISYAPESSSSFKTMTTHPSLGTVIAIGMTFSVLAPIAEELFFRGMLYVRLRKKYTHAKSACILSLIFGLCHVTFLSPFVFSLLMCKVNRYTGSLRYSIMIHMLSNAFFTLGSIFMYFYLAKNFVEETGTVASVYEDSLLLVFLLFSSAVLFYALWKIIPERDDEVSAPLV